VVFGFAGTAGTVCGGAARAAGGSLTVQTQRIAAQSATAGGACVVLLPGAYQQLTDFIHRGFDTALQQRRVALDLILAAPEPAHLTDRNWLPRLHDEVVHPARAAGEMVWLGGISLGAFMALRFAAQYPQLIDGLCLIAPYLGSRIVAAEIARCPPQSWQPGALADDDDERHIWRYLQGLRAPKPQVFLGFGTHDRFADTQRLLARTVPHASARQIAGGHDWPVWRELWDNFLDHYWAEP
jgi:pimeloyl-ACP methyl ester carboxylesterase